MRVRVRWVKVRVRWVRVRVRVVRVRNLACAVEAEGHVTAGSSAFSAGKAALRTRPQRWVGAVGIPVLEGACACQRGMQKLLCFLVFLVRAAVAFQRLRWGAAVVGRPLDELCLCVDVRARARARRARRARARGQAPAC